MTEGQSTKNTGQYIWLLFAIIIIAVYFFGLNLPLLGPDEPRYSQVAREMFERGDWITPKLGGFDWFEKPALLYWLQIFSYHLFGVNEFAARFGSAIFGLGTILSLWILGRFTATEDTENTEKRKEQNFQKSVEKQSLEKDFSNSVSVNSVSSAAKKDFANWLALISASSLGLIVFSHAASFDIILTFPITAALVAFFLFDQSKEKSGFTFYFCLLTFYLFIGISLIAKGLVGIVFPFAIVAFYHVLSWKLPSKTFIISLFWGTILSFIVACAWYLPMYQANGWKFIDEFFIQHHFQRYTSNKYQHPQPFYFFFWVLPLMTLPWLPFFLASIWDFAKAIFHRRDAETQRIKTETETSGTTETTETNETAARKFSFLPFSPSPLLLFAFSWLLVPLVFFSVSGSKLPGYILPSLPGALILTADFVYKFVQKSAKRQFYVQLTAFLTFIGVMIVLQFFVMKFANFETVKDLVSNADRDGYSATKILNFHTVSHNLEFYGTGRLLRNPDGKIKRVDGVSEIVEYLQTEEKEILIVVPLQYSNQLTENNRIETKVLGDNGELAIAAVKLK